MVYALRSYSIERQGWVSASAPLLWAARLAATARKKAIVLALGLSPLTEFQHKVVSHQRTRSICTPQLGRARRRENVGERPNDPPIENGYARRREIMPQADAERGCRIQQLLEVAHSTGGKVMQHHECPSLCTALRKRAIDPSIPFLPVARNGIPQYVGTAPNSRLHEGLGGMRSKSGHHATPSC